MEAIGNKHKEKKIKEVGRLAQGDKLTGILKWHN